MSEGWLRARTADEAELARRAEQRLGDRIDRGVLDREEIERVTSRPLRTAHPRGGAGLDAYRRLCVAWEIDRPERIRSHRPWIGPVLVVGKSVLARVFRFLVERPLARQAEFNRNLVVVLGELIREDSERR